MSRGRVETVNTHITLVHLCGFILGSGGLRLSQLTGLQLPVHPAPQSSSLGTRRMSPSDRYDAGSHQQLQNTRTASQGAHLLCVGLL